MFNNVNSISAFKNSVFEFYKILYKVIEQSVPKVLPKKSFCQIWYTSELKALKNKKNKAYKKYKQYNSISDLSMYTKLRYDFNILNNICYNDYICTIKNNIKNNSSHFFKFVNTKRKTSEYPLTFKYNDVVSENDDITANLFSNFFSSTYLDNIFDDSNSYPYDIVSVDIIPPSVDEIVVLKYLKSMKFCTKPGPDKIPSCLLKECSETLYVPLAKLFSLSQKLSFVPDIWKSSYIIPLYKSGSRNEVSNYRGIAKLNDIPKLFEHIIADQLSFSLKNVFSTFQHGFVRNRSTVTNLLEFTCEIFQSFQNRLQTDVVYTDFSKAFDIVNHSLLLKKLELIGFPPSLKDWVSSYLSNRTQHVLFRNCISKPISVLSGVPQGSHLGPLLFNLFINDLPSVIRHASILMYADDVKLFLSVSNVLDYSYLQYDINNV